MNYSTQKGLMTELSCQTDFTRYGILLSQPIINDSRYDFLADINNKIYKIQCKSATPIDEDNSAIAFSVTSKNWNNGEYKDYHNQIDFFYTCYNKQGYLIPINEVGKKAKTLRFFTDKSNVANPQISWAQDYRIEKILTDTLNYDIPKFVSPMPQRLEHRCLDCGTCISQTATYCNNCIKKYRKTKVTKPNREELKHMIRTNSFIKIGEKYGISDNAVRRWCDSYNLPRNARKIKLITDEEWKDI